MNFLEAELEYKANDIKLRLSAPQPLPFLYEPDYDESQTCPSIKVYDWGLGGVDLGLPSPLQGRLY